MQGSLMWNLETFGRVTLNMFGFYIGSNCSCSEKNWEDRWELDGRYATVLRQTHTHTHTCFTPPSSPSLSTILILTLLVNDRSAVFLFHTFPVSLSVFFMHRHTSYPCQVRRLLWLPDQGGHLRDILMSPVCMHECELTPWVCTITVGFVNKTPVLTGVWFSHTLIIKFLFL